MFPSIAGKSGEGVRLDDTVFRLLPLATSEPDATQEPGGPPEAGIEPEPGDAPEPHEEEAG